MSTPPPSLPSLGANARGNDVTHTAGLPPLNMGGFEPTSAPGATSNSGRPPRGPSQQTPPPTPGAATEGNHQGAEQASKNADGSGANDTLLLTVLVLGFTAAVGGMVIAAGRRGGRRVH